MRDPADGGCLLIDAGITLSRKHAETPARIEALLSALGAQQRH